MKSRTFSEYLVEARALTQAWEKNDSVSPKRLAVLSSFSADFLKPFIIVESSDLVPLLPVNRLESQLKPWRDEMSKLDSQVKRLEAEFAAAYSGDNSPPDLAALPGDAQSPAQHALANCYRVRPVPPGAAHAAADCPLTGAHRRSPYPPDAPPGAGPAALKLLQWGPSSPHR